MYTPITWASPNKLKHLREKRSAERMDQSQVGVEMNNASSLKQKFTELFSIPFSLAKTVKLSLSS